MSPYIPRGYVTTAQAVDYVFQVRHPDLAATTSAREVEMRRLHSEINTMISRASVAVALSNLGARNIGIDQPLGTISSENAARLKELEGVASEASCRHADAAIELRSALAEGDLVAVLNCEEMPAVPKFRWRKDDGLTIVREGRLSHQVKGAHTESTSCATLIKEAELMGWLGLLLQTGGRSANHTTGRATKMIAQTTGVENEMTTSAPIGDALAATEWMTAYAMNYLAERGVPCKRDDTLAACQSGTRPHSTYRQALAAWKALPSNLKRTRQQTDRTMIRQMTGQ
jgi:hypothetical protein